MQALFSQSNETSMASPTISALDLTGSLYGEIYEVADKLMCRERLHCSLQSISERTVGEKWRFAKARLCRAMSSDQLEREHDNRGVRSAAARL
jgi:hypothetical protein